MIDDQSGATFMIEKLGKIFTLKNMLLALLAVSYATAQDVAEPYSVVHGWPSLPEDQMLGQVSGVAVDSQNRVCIFQRAEHSWADDKSQPIPSPTILCFDSLSGKILETRGTNFFLEPHGLRIDSKDNIWVTDTGLHQVFKFSPDGKLLMKLGTARSPGLDNSHFDKPSDIAFGLDGSIFVADGEGNNNRIAKFSAAGEFLLAWGRKGDGSGEFNVPHSVVVDSRGLVYVADRGNSRIQVFTAEGRFVKIWGSDALGRPWGLAIGPDNVLFVVDGGDSKPTPPDKGRILKLDLQGNILASWSRYGNYDGQICGGHDIAVGKDGAVYVGDVFRGMRVQKFVPR
jgi:peptidylamidoglycolate lyase